MQGSKRRSRCAQCKTWAKPGSTLVKLPFHSPLLLRRFDSLQFCHWECARAYSQTRLPVQLRHEVGILIDVTAARLVDIQHPA